MIMGKFIYKYLEIIINRDVSDMTTQWCYNNLFLWLSLDGFYPRQIDEITLLPGYNLTASFYE